MYEGYYEKVNDRRHYRQWTNDNPNPVVKFLLEPAADSEHVDETIAKYGAELLTLLTTTGDLGRVRTFAYKYYQFFIKHWSNLHMLVHATREKYGWVKK